MIILSVEAILLYLIKLLGSFISTNCLDKLSHLFRNPEISFSSIPKIERFRNVLNVAYYLDLCFFLRLPLSFSLSFALPLTYLSQFQFIWLFL